MCHGMATRSSLVALSSAQLAVQLAGLAVAVRRRRNFDIGFMRGSPTQVVRDEIWAGTAYSAPAYLIVAQWWATARLRRRPDDGARRVLGLLGVLYVPGYLSERFVRAHLRGSGFDPVETPVALASVGLAAAMGALGHRESSGA